MDVHLYSYWSRVTEPESRHGRNHVRWSTVPGGGSSANAANAPRRRSSETKSLTRDIENPPNDDLWWTTPISCCVSAPSVPANSRHFRFKSPSHWASSVNNVRRRATILHNA